MVWLRGSLASRANAKPTHKAMCSVYARCDFQEG